MTSATLEQSRVQPALTHFYKQNKTECMYVLSRIKGVHFTFACIDFIVQDLVCIKLFLLKEIQVEKQV